MNLFLFTTWSELENVSRAWTWRVANGRVMIISWWAAPLNPGAGAAGEVVGGEGEGSKTPLWVSSDTRTSEQKRQCQIGRRRRALQNLFIFYWNSTNIYPVHGAHQLLICRLHINSAEIHQETAELINRLGLKDLQLWGLLIYQKRQTIEKSPLPHTWIPRAEPR